MVTTEGVRQGRLGRSPYHSKAWLWLRRKVLGRVGLAWPFTIPFQGLAMVTTEGVRQGGLGRSPYHSKAWLWLRRKVLGRVGLAVHHTIPRPGYGYDGRC